MPQKPETEQGEGFSIADIPPTREIEPYNDITAELLHEITLVNTYKPIFRDVDFLDVYSKYWETKAKPNTEQTKPIMVNQNVVGAYDSLPSADPLNPGFLAVPYITNTLGNTESREYLIKNQDGSYTLLKGVGTRAHLANSPSEHSNQIGYFGKPEDQKEREEKGWGSTGGLLKDNARSEFYNGYMIAEGFNRVFGHFPNIRLPKQAYLVTEALQAEGQKHVKKDHFQLAYEIQTPVRNLYNTYIDNPANLWRGLDMENPEHQQIAMDKFNTILSTYPALHGATDIKLPTREEYAELFKCALDYTKAWEGEDEPIFPTKNGSAKTATEETYDREFQLPNMSDKDKRTIMDLRERLSVLGHSLAHKFYIANKEVVDSTILKEATDLAELVGFSSALNIKLNSAVVPKDTYGGKAADLDAIKIYRGPDADEKSKNTIAFFSTTNDYANAAFSILCLCDMMGADKQEETQALSIFLNTASGAFRETYTNTDKLNISPERKQAIDAYYKRLSKSIYSAEEFYRLVVAANSDLIEGVPTRHSTSLSYSPYVPGFNVQLGAGEDEDDALVEKKAIPRNEYALNIRAIANNGHIVVYS